MKKVLSILFCLCVLLSVCGCGSKSDPLKGTWEGSNRDYGQCTWTFDGKDKVVFGNEFLGEFEGKYVVEEGNKMTISLWDAENPYTYEIVDGKLNLTSVDELAPSFEGLTKK